ncbi:MAG TPA: sulfate adenylyltransferase [Thermoplasmatales archaeon]|nr:sulfate adenylyltransferase [Thermoplasmatales archaeon]
MPKPHGGRLVDRCNLKKDIDTENSIVITIDRDRAEDVENIAHGVFSPLEGFFCYNDLESVMENMRLENDTPWTIPILLDLDKQMLKGVKEGDVIFLKNPESNLIAEMEIEEIYATDKKRLAKRIYGTNDTSHPGVNMTYNMSDLLVGGKITLLREGKKQFEKYALKPKETRILFKEKGWREIVAFQTRNPPHVGHEYVQKSALTFVDGLFINPLIGRKKKGDFKDEVILAAYEALLRHYYLKNRAVLAILCTSMKYAGPREAIHHAIMRKNFGCTHFIVGRDHAGVGNFYEPYAAHEIFNEFPDLGITPLFFRSFFYCKKCGSVVNEKICPHGKEEHVNFSGTKIREMLKEGKIPPSDMMRPEVAGAILSFDNPFIE